MSAVKHSRKASRRSYGSIRRLPSGRFQARYRDASGTIRTAPETFDSKTAADNWLTTERADLVRGVWRNPDVGAIALADYLSDWITRRTDLRPAARELYSRHLERWIARPLQLPGLRGARPTTIDLGAVHVNALTVADIRDWYAAAHATQVRETAERSARGDAWRAARRHPARSWAMANGLDIKATGRLRPEVLTAWKRAGAPTELDLAPVEVDLNVSPAPVIAQAYRTLRAGLNAAVRDGLIAANPCQIPRAGHAEAARRQPATSQEVAQLCAAMPARFAVAVEVAAYSALRAGELFAQARSHVDVAAGTVRVERGLQEVAGEPLRFGPPKTPSSLRTVHLPPRVMQRLSDHMDSYTESSSNALVFAHPDGSPVTKAQRTRMFAQARKAIGREDLRFHDLRHTGATLAAQAGASIEELRHRLGHSTVSAAMRYQHASAERDRELARRLDAMSAPMSNVVPFNGVQSGRSA